MDLTRITELSITFGTLQILQPGDVIDASDGVLDFDTQYSVEAIRAVGAAVPTLDEYGNTVRDGSISIAVEHESIQAALADILTRQAAVDEAGKLATLTYSATNGTSTATRSYTAGLQRLTQSTSRSANGVRVVHTYSWIIAGVVATAQNARAITAVVNVPITGPEFGIENSEGEWICGTDWPGHTLTAEDVQDYCDFVNAAPEVQGKAVLSWDGELLTVELVGEYAGAAGNGYKLAAGAMMPWEGSPEFSGGVG